MFFKNSSIGKINWKESKEGINKSQLWISVVWKSSLRKTWNDKDVARNKDDF